MMKTLMLKIIYFYFLIQATSALYWTGPYMENKMDLVYAVNPLTIP